MTREQMIDRLVEIAMDDMGFPYSEEEYRSELEEMDEAWLEEAIALQLEDMESEVTGMKFERANACYTGGNIYVYYGKLEDGRYFLADDDGEMMLTETDPETCFDDVFYWEWQTEHGIQVTKDQDDMAEPGQVWWTLKAADWNAMLDWIITNKPDGNYSVSELEARKEF